MTDSGSLHIVDDLNNGNNVCFRVLAINQGTGVIPGNILGNEIRSPTKRAKALFNEGYRLQRVDPEEFQPKSIGPGNRCPALAEKAREQMARALDVVSLDNQRSLVAFNHRNGG